MAQATTIEHTRGGRATLGVLLLASTMTVMAGAVLSPVLEVIRGELGISGTAAGFVLTIHALAVAVVSPAVGTLLDRVGVRRPLAAALLLYGVAGGAGTFIDSYALLLASRVVFGVAAAVVFSGTTVAMLTLYRGAVRDRVMGWRQTATSLGGVTWPLLGGAVGGLSWHAPFAIYVLGIPLGILVWRVMPADEARGAGDAARPSAPGGSIALLRRAPALLGWYGLLGTSAVLLYTLVVFMPIRLGELGIHTPLLVASINMASTLAMTVTGLVYARLRARFSYPVMLRTAVGLWAVAFALLGLTSSVAVIVVAMALFGVGAAMVMPAVTVLIGDSAPAEQQGRATAMSGMAVFAGQFASPLLLGPVVDSTSTQTGYAGAAGVAGVLLLVMCWLRPGGAATRTVPVGADVPQAPDAAQVPPRPVPARRP